jgi:hypothetical protein
LKANEPSRQNPHRRTPGKSSFADIVGPMSPQIVDLNNSKQKISVYSFDQPKAMFYTPLFSEKRKSTQMTPKSTVKTSKPKKLND